MDESNNVDNNLRTEDVFIQIRDKLNKEGIKLWLDPYYSSSNGLSESSLSHLAKQYSTSLHLRYEMCYNTLVTLQSNALEKLKHFNEFKENGLATVKIKILQQNVSTKLITQQVHLHILGLSLKTVVQSEVNVPFDRIKLISGGVLIKDEENLLKQSFKPITQVLAIILDENINDLKTHEESIREIEATRADTALLALDDGYIQLEDQCGNAVNIPKREKEALMIAMALHEKGRSSMKEQNCAKALVFFLDADSAFRECNSRLLDKVDNYALLNLDISWCYLCLQSLMHLPEAHERLKKCEDNFHRTYGPNLERLIALKGTPGNEAALFMRLHLLQAIVLYHQNKRQEARSLLEKAKHELLSLKVDDESLLALVELGYSPTEARLALRATSGDVNMAANYINEKRKLRKESRRKAMSERIFQRESEKLGICADNKQHVDPNFVKMLVNMGYGREAARIALQKTNNVISDSIQYIQENPAPGPSSSKSQEFLALIEDLVPELVAAGFDYAKAKLALQKHAGDVMKAAEELLLNNGVIQDETDNGVTINSPNIDIQQDKQLKEDALSRLSQDISMVDDDYLDLTLQKEEVFLKTYLSLLEEQQSLW